EVTSDLSRQPAREQADEQEQRHAAGEKPAGFAKPPFGDRRLWRRTGALASHSFNAHAADAAARPPPPCVRRSARSDAPPPRRRSSRRVPCPADRRDAAVPAASSRS